MIKFVAPALLILLAACGGRYGRGLPTSESQAAAYFQAQNNRPAPVARMQPFMAMVGTFDWELRYTPYPGGAPIDFGGTCEFHPGFGDTWIFGNWYMPGDDESMFLTLMGYSTARKRYLFGAIDGRGGAPSGEGIAVESIGASLAVEYEMSMVDPTDTSRRILFKRILRIIDQDTIEAIDYRSGWNGSLVPFNTLSLTRRDT